MDYTVEKYKQLLLSLNSAGFEGERLLLRHDVDLLPDYSLRIARLEASLGMKSVYYFRTVPESWDDEIIKEIEELGHEVGYHYESLTTCDGNMEESYLDFCQNLAKLSDLIGHPVRSICMHGSPRSKYDSKDLWKYYDYHELGVEYEPYLDTDFSKTLYLTDTGRRWDGYKVSVRDKIPGYQEEWNRMGLSFHSTDDIIRALEDPDSPLRTCGLNLMITTHPQRWMPFGFGWMKELILQKLKNIVKLFIAR